MFSLNCACHFRDSSSSRFFPRNDTEKSLDKLRELEKSIDGWDGKKITQSCTELVMGAL